MSVPLLMILSRAVRTSGVKVATTILLAIVVVTLYLPLHAQGTAATATLYGTVSDPQGNPIASVTLHLQFDGEASPLTTRTDAQGQYTFASLRPGVYTLKSENAGYVAATIPSILLATKESKTLDLKLERAAPPVSTPAPQFFDPPQFTVSGVTDTTSLGGHGSDVVVRTRDTITKETVSLRTAQPAAATAPPDVEKSLREQVERNPRNFAANHQLGKALMQRGDAREAIRYLQSAAELNPANFENNFDLALAYANAGDYRRAREKADPLLAHNDTAPLHHLMADIQEKLGNPLEAVREYQRAAELDPSEPHLFDWGSELLLHHAPEPAEQVFTRAIRLFPDSIRMRIGLGAAEFAGGSYEKALNQICEASDRKPDDPAPYLFLGKMQRAERTPSNPLVEKLHRFVTLHPDSAEANYYYAVVLWKQGTNSPSPATTAQVESLLQHALLLDPKFAAAYLQLGILHLEQKKLPAAISDLQNAVQAAPDLEEAHYRLTQAYREAGQTERAKAEVQLYQRLAQEDAQKNERERHEIRQFVYTLRDQSPKAN